MAQQVLGLKDAQINKKNWYFTLTETLWFMQGTKCWNTVKGTRCN